MLVVMLIEMCYNSGMEDKRIKFNRFVIELFLAIGIIFASLAIIAELNGYAFIPHAEVIRFTRYRHYNFLTKLIEIFNMPGYWGMNISTGLLDINGYAFRFVPVYYIFFLIFQLWFYYNLGWITATLMFPLPKVSSETNHCQQSIAPPAP